MSSRAVVVAGVLCAGIALCGPASASPILWTDWVSDSPGSQIGTIGAITVTYTGNSLGMGTGFASWTPSSTYAGGVIDNAPPQAYGAVYLTGGSGSGTETITFSQAVSNPVMSIWSLGSPGASARFVFPANEPISLQAGGPSADIPGGSSIGVSGTTVTGGESNGSILISGRFTTVTFTTPDYENWYGFTVGVPIPQPGSLMLLASGLAGLGMIARRRQA